MPMTTSPMAAFAVLPTSAGSARRTAAVAVNFPFRPASRPEPAKPKQQKPVNPFEQVLNGVDDKAVREMAGQAAESAGKAALTVAKAGANWVGTSVSKKAKDDMNKVGAAGGIVAALVILYMAESVPLLPQALELSGLFGIYMFVKSL
eukprot:CAMPEP_0198325506 /NCGR_PEP_ID=MMETSP1450-20131203/13251_1 /TAXON_ID=753684 ORGANISM="Madagascaria erythrocladiodes, Strain CCMP3234" /NCGR_SAMPLE_ID=MMETSP1450 /ASSEMBLY_ACC=CAM_ASM_001115 /LENGTH=147 /DNA_ID=CAMNT_0044029411 /DNA_START=136 /DNA_END=576 /DNA_ORIENTATION=+